MRDVNIVLPSIHVAKASSGVQTILIVKMRFCYAFHMVSISCGKMYLVEQQVHMYGLVIVEMSKRSIGDMRREFVEWNMGHLHH